MKKLLSLALVACIGVAAPASASLINFEYTRTADPTGTGPQTYTYEMQFWVDRDDAAYVDTLGINQILINIGDVNEGDGRGPRPFGNGFITEVQSGFTATDLTFRPNFTGITPNGPGFVFFVPTEDLFSVRFTGVSEVLADMSWNYFGRFDPTNNTTGFSGSGVSGREILAPVNALTDFDAVAPIPLPAALPLLLAGLGGLALFRRRTAA